MSTIGGPEGTAAVVTGGGSGIGRAVAELLERSGSAVHVVDLTGDEQVDVTDRAALDRVADEVAAAHGGLDVQRCRRADSESPGRRAARGRLRESRGAIVNVASQAALVSLPQRAAYTAAKGAVAALTRSLAIDWAEHGIRVNAVAPGFTLTPMTEGFFENETFTCAPTSRIPLGRILRAEEIAGAIVFLASPLASAVTGVTLPVDGGWTAGEPALPW